MEEICSSEASVDFYRTTWRFIPEDRILHSITNLLRPGLFQVALFMLEKHVSVSKRGNHSILRLFVSNIFTIGMYINVMFKKSVNVEKQRPEF
jgi:hypothetical protein